MSERDNDAYEGTVSFYCNYREPPPRITIGDVTYEWPAGTTREEAQAVLDEAKLLVLSEMTESHDPGDEDRS